MDLIGLLKQWLKLQCLKKQLELLDYEPKLIRQIQKLDDEILKAESIIDSTGANKLHADQLRKRKKYLTLALAKVASFNDS